MRLGKIEQWRVLWWPTPSGPEPFLAGLAEMGPDPRPRGIITSPLVSGQVVQGDIVQTRSGSVYKLGTPSPEGETPDYIRDLVSQRLWAMHGPGTKDIRDLEDILRIQRKLDVLAEQIVSGKIRGESENLF